MAPSRQLLTLIFGAFLMTPPASAASRIVTASEEPLNPNLPADAAPDSCFAHEYTPAIIETVTEKTPLTPARVAIDIETGETEIIRPATFDTVTVQRIIQEREELWFETLCPQLYSERFVNSLQRALRARGFYSGELTGWMDVQTNIAIKLYQRKFGLNSQILALKTAEEFGLTSHSDFKDVGQGTN
ncbi:MAG: peptidoglycan-binding protein [Rhodobacteraceae bacterium]|nr:peptidoglycan-binding protein [Paracoccaceae bacterium]